ncbi:hypothetical protein JZ751_010652 [Albula glossodonta]|uniref:Gamma-aminobutyric acid receptor subunit pi n=1 Tax=Albula glossodonta TaxID=121402 RepID=A0A8T2N7D2_9TELE|nr:hypothetical protein JZ751_010652 [Albula glossodonta]
MWGLGSEGDKTVGKRWEVEGDSGQILHLHLCRPCSVRVSLLGFSVFDWGSVCLNGLLYVMMEDSMLSAEVKERDVLPPTIHKLMKGYNKYLRPFFDMVVVAEVVAVVVVVVAVVLGVAADYTATIFLRQRWTDERLCFKGNKSLSLDGRLVELLWVPDTFIVDSKKSFLHDITVENRLIRIFPNGTVLYAIRITTTVACNMDLTKYPMDKQTCTLQLESWGYNVNDVMFYWTRGNESVSGLDTLQLAQYTLEDYYTSESEAVYETGRYPKLIFHFELKRSILYFILETYVPSSLLVVLSWVSFWISQSSVGGSIPGFAIPSHGQRSHWRGNNWLASPGFNTGGPTLRGPSSQRTYIESQRTYTEALLAKGPTVRGPFSQRTYSERPLGPSSQRTYIESQRTYTEALLAKGPTVRGPFSQRTYSERPLGPSSQRTYIESQRTYTEALLAKGPTVRGPFSQRTYSERPLGPSSQRTYIESQRTYTEALLAKGPTVRGPFSQRTYSERPL